jgi:hypothetical protein
MIIACGVAACLLAGCSPSPDDVTDSLGLPESSVLEERVAQLLPTATDLGLPEHDANGFPTVEPYAGGNLDCGVTPLASGGIGVVAGNHAAIEKVFVFADASAAQKFYTRLSRGRCPDWPKAPRVELPPLGDRSRAYVRDEADCGQSTSCVSYGSWVLLDRNVLHIVTQNRKQLRHYSAAAAKAAHT